MNESQPWRNAPRLPRKSRQQVPPIIAELREARLVLGMSQADLADRLGYSEHGTIARWERGETSPRLASLLDWSQALGFQLKLQGILGIPEIIRTKELVKRLREVAEGPAICPDCGNERGKEWHAECLQEGQCAWNRDYGLHSDSFSNPWQAKLDMIEAANLLEQYYNIVRENQK
jgi:transcriptional regulator with XRE-family HTH domain